jgi:predicted nucleotidyltransferase
MGEEITKNKHPISRNMNANNHDILNDFSRLLRLHLSDNLKDLVLFGSRMAGKAKKDSDYDFLVILKQKADWKTEREISDLSYEIELKYNIVTDTHVLGESELTTLRGKQPIYVNAIERGMHA